MREQRDGGAAAVEFALLLPVLLGLVFGTVDMGVWLNQKITATEAARQAVRVYALTQGDAAVKSTASLTALNAALDRTPKITTAQATFSGCTTITGTTVSVATVSFAYPSPATIGLIPGLSTLTIRAKAVYACTEF